MASDPRVLGLLAEILDAGKTPEEVCRGYPELLAGVRERWKEFRRIDAAVGEWLPGLRTAPDVGVVTPVPPAGGLPQVPGYELFGEVGRGGMAVVYRARDLALDRDVAVKLLQDAFPADSPVARRFTDEARITGQLQHPGVPAVYQVGGVPGGRPFLAMKLIKGRTLAALLGERPDPAADRGRFVAIFEHVCQTVAYAHSLRVIHRDLKPSNVMVGRFGEVQVMDWGLAKVLPAGGPPGGGPSRELHPGGDGTVIRTRPAAAADTPGGSGSPAPPTRAGTVLGTPAYMAPEQAGGEVDRLDERSDVFGLGAVLCEVLTGKPPYTGRDVGQLVHKATFANQADAHARLDGCGAEPELVTLCRRCLAAEPDDRPRDARAVAEAVAALRAAAEDRARRAELDRVRAAEQGKRRRVLLAASGVVALVLLAALGVSLWQMVRAMDAEGRAKSNEAAANEQRDLKAKALEAERKARQQAYAALPSMTADVVERKFAQGAVLTADDKAFLRGVIAQFDAFAAIQGDDADSRAARAEGRFRVGRMRYRLGELKEAEADFDAGLGIQKPLAANFPTRPEFRQELANGHNDRGVLLRATGRLEEAEADFGAALCIRKQLAADFPNRPDFRQELANGHNDRGVLLKGTGRLKEAEADYDAALDIYKQLAADFLSRPEFRWELAASHNNRGNLLSATGRFKEAEADYDAALRIQEQLAADFPNQSDLHNAVAGTCTNLAFFHRLQGNWAAAKRLLLEGRPHHLATLKANPRHPTYRQFYRNHLKVLTEVHAGLLEKDEAVRTAEGRRDLGWDPPADAYDAAGFLSGCVPIAAKHQKLDDQRRKESAQSYTEAAMKLLREAVSKGYKDVAHLKNDTDFDPLRQRDDFEQLVAELEGKGK
jgi:serine/threonine protein kinase